MAESKEELKNLLMRVKESEKAGLKLNIQKFMIRASRHITSLQTEGEKEEAGTDFLFSCAPISPQMVTVDMKVKDACSLEEKL